MNNKKDELGVSVLIRCYNSTDVLTDTLGYLAKQKIRNEISWEIIIVDNNSEDELFKFIQSFRPLLPNIRYIEEKKAGSLYSQIAGIMASKYKYVLFCDDDNQLDENYVQLAFDFMEEKSNAHIGALGGRATAKTYPKTQLPEWFQEHQINYAVGEQAEQSGVLPATNELWSAGTMIRKRAYMEFREKNVTHIFEGRVGKSGAGEDTELFLWYKIYGYDLYYWSDLHFYHFIRSNRLTKKYLETLQANIQAQLEIMKGYRILLIISRYDLMKKILELFKLPVYLLLTKTLKQSIMLSYFFGSSLSKYDPRLTQALDNFKKIKPSRAFLFP